MNSPENANASLMGSLFLTILTWSPPSDIDFWLRAITGVGACVGVIFAVRYHIAAKKREDAARILAEEELRRLREDEQEEE